MMMKQIYSILLLVLSIFCSTSCETSDEERDIIFFSGDTPIYETGTCTNLLSSLTLYTIRTEGARIGIDGGDGDYSLKSGNEEVATAVLSSDKKAVILTPKALGNTTITVSDGNGKTAILPVKVVDYVLDRPVISQQVLVSGNVTPERKAEIVAEEMKYFNVKIGGGYRFIPDKMTSDLESGQVIIYAEKWGGVEKRIRYKGTKNEMDGKEYREVTFDFVDISPMTYIYAYVRDLPPSRMNIPMPYYFTLREDISAKYQSEGLNVLRLEVSEIPVINE